MAGQLEGDRVVPTRPGLRSGNAGVGWREKVVGERTEQLRVEEDEMLGRTGVGEGLVRHDTDGLR